MPFHFPRKEPAMSELDTKKPNNQDDLADVKSLIGNEDFAESIRTKREQYFYNLGSGGVHGAKYIIRYLIEKKKEKENNS